jgi:two-component system CheB/CheR fusion protein
VRKAGDGPTALRIAREFKPQLVVCDIGLPGMDGLEVTRRLREQSAGALPLIVAMTGYARDEDRRLSEQAGFDHHLVKPVDPGLLMTMINELGERASLKKAPAV